MAINVGLGSKGKQGRVLRLSLSEGDERLARQYWPEDRPRIKWSGMALSNNRYILRFKPDANGNQARVEHPPAGENTRPYLCWSWTLEKHKLARLASIRARAHEGETIRWTDDGTLEIIVRMDKPEQQQPTRSRKRAEIAERVATTSASTATHRLSALRDAMNQALRDLKAHGLNAVINQPKPGGDISINIQI